MARKLRIEYKGALHHVINRGNYRRELFEMPGAAPAFVGGLYLYGFVENSAVNRWDLLGMLDQAKANKKTQSEHGSMKNGANDKWVTTIYTRPGAERGSSSSDFGAEASGVGIFNSSIDSMDLSLLAVVNQARVGATWGDHSLLGVSAQPGTMSIVFVGHGSGGNYTAFINALTSFSSTFNEQVSAVGFVGCGMDCFNSPVGSIGAFPMPLAIDPEQVTAALLAIPPKDPRTAPDSFLLSGEYTTISSIDIPQLIDAAVASAQDHGGLTNPLGSNMTVVIPTSFDLKDMERDSRGGGASQNLLNRIVNNGRVIGYEQE